MNNVLAMDQSDKVGLGAAVGGHALLLALLVFGLYRAATPMGSDGGGSGDGIAVELVSEGAAAASEPAPAVVEEIEEIPVPIDETVVDPEPALKPLPKVQPKPDQLVKPQAKPQVKPQPKPSPKPVKTVTGRGGGKSDFEKEMEKRLGGLGGGVGTDKTKGQGEGGGKGLSKEVIAQKRSEASNKIASEVRPFVPDCAPSTSDNSYLIVYVQMTINKSASLTSSSVYKVEGITPGNRAQVELMKACALSSLRRASAYELDPASYETWKNLNVKLKVNFK
jgi:periplasmic protein TonB